MRPLIRALMARRVTLAMILLPIAVAGWGYWRALSHAVLHVSLYDVALKTDRQAYGSVLAAEVTFNDARGQAIARGRADGPWGVVSMVHPDVGDCQQEQRAGGAAWQQCFEAQSQWFHGWVPLVRTARIRLDGCTIDRVPVVIDESRDAWWLWWVPLPHIGNSPYTYFNLTMWVDSARCRPASADR